MELIQKVTQDNTNKSQKELSKVGLLTDDDLTVFLSFLVFYN